MFSKKTRWSLLHVSYITGLFFVFSGHGCNLLTTNGIVKTDSDTYKISMAGEDSLEVRQHVWQKADSFCQKKKQYFMPISKTYNQELYEMAFRCLNAGDPELLEGEIPFQGKRYHKKLGGYGEVKY